MRPVVRGHHDQLHRPSGARHSRPHPAARAALVGIAVRRHRLLVQPRLRLRFLAAGRPLDRVGVRRGFAVAVVAWSIAAIGHAFARTAAGFSAARALLGLGESANFPGAIKTVAEWFPKRERALATGIFNAGTNTGAIVTPLVVPWIVLTWGWPWAFIATGSLGFLWLVLWLALYRSPEAQPRLTPDELAHIRSDSGEEAESVGPWIRLVSLRQDWAFAAGD